MKAIASLCFLLNTVLWATFYAVSKEALHRIDPLVFACFEVLTTLPPALVILYVVRKDVNLDVVKRGITLGMVLGLNVFTTTIALKFTTATNTAFFPALNGFMAALIARGLLKQQINPATWMAGALSLGGALMLILESSSHGLWFGDLIAFAGAVFYTIYIFMVDHQTKANVSPWALFAIELITLAVVSSLVAVTAGNWRAVHPDIPKDIIVIVYIGLATTLLPTAISIFMQRYVSAVTVAFIYILEPVWGALAAAVYLSESLAVRGYIGGALIVSGAVIKTWNDSRPPMIHVADEVRTEGA